MLYLSLNMPPHAVFFIQTHGSALSNIISKQKHLRCKKGAAKNLKGLVEKDVKSKWAAKASCFLTGLKILIIVTSLQIIVILGGQGLLMLMESKF